MKVCRHTPLRYDAAMAVHDFDAQRLWIAHDLAAGGEIALTREQSNYLRNVLRMGDGDNILVFNGHDGEWRARLRPVGKRDGVLELESQTRPQDAPPNLIYLFAPLKRARLDYMVQKAVEMGVGRLMPVLTRRTVAERVNLQRMRANAIEAAEQCGILSLPDIEEPQQLAAVLEDWPDDLPLVFCDEAATVTNPLDTLQRLKAGRPPDGKIAVLVGPEGGFDPAERQQLLRLPFVIPLSLGPRIMRADTAAVAVLALINAALGDWYQTP